VKDFRIVFLDVTSWIGISLGAEHHYGRLSFEVRPQKLDNIDKYKEVELKRRLGAKEVKDLNKKDSSLGLSMYGVGEKTHRFNSQVAVFVEARKVWRKKFPKAHILIDGQTGIIQPQRIMEVVEGLENTMKRANKLFKQFDDLGRWDIKENQRRVNKIDQKWIKLIMPRWAKETK